MALQSFSVFLGPNGRYSYQYLLIAANISDTELQLGGWHFFPQWDGCNYAAYNMTRHSITGSAFFKWTTLYKCFFWTHLRKKKKRKPTVIREWRDVMNRKGDNGGHLSFKLMIRFAMQGSTFAVSKSTPR